MLEIKSKVDVLLVNPGCRTAVYQELGNALSAIEPPSLAALFATYLRKKSNTVDIVDALVYNLSPNDAAVHIYNNFDATLIVMVVYGFQPSASTQNMTAASETCAALKALNPNCKIMMTGTHPSALPERTLVEEAVDFVCSQEGPQTIQGLIELLKSNNHDYARVPSLYYKWKGVVMSTPKSDLLDNLDEDMPGAAWDLLPMDKYRAHNWHCFDHIFEREPYVSMHTTLGCPYKCTFCCINSPFGKASYRMWSPDTVIKEIDVLVNQYGIKNIKFVDEMFVLNKEHVLGICDRIIERGYNLNIWAYARVDTVKDEFLEKLFKAGVRWLALGIESGSKHVRDNVLKGRFGYEDILAVVKKVQAAGIHVIGNYIFGLPDDTFESMQETFSLAYEANCEFANFYCAMAYPGSKLYDMAMEKGWELPETWVGYSQHSYECQPLCTDELTAAEVLNFRDKVFHAYFSSKQYLALVKKKFGQDVVDHLIDMNKIKLKRKIVEEARAAGTLRDINPKTTSVEA